MANGKPKVALISFHNAYNYGAAMQAFALQEALRDIGVDAEYIDYVNEERKNKYNNIYQAGKALNQKNTIRAVKLLAGSYTISERKKKFNTFYEKHLKKTERIYRSSSEARALNGMYDKFIVGSDQVWNCENNGGDTAFLLDFVANPDEKISYASSFGMTDIPPEYLSAYTKALNNIGRISVRETAGAKIVEKYTGRKPHVVLDPVFLANLHTWESLKKEGTVKKEDYIFFYTNKDSQVRDFWNLGYPKTGMKSHILSSTVGVKDFIDRSTSVRVAMAPADFLNEIAEAKLVVTASFHCVAFSIIFHKQFAVFLTGNRGKDERILNLLHVCGLESRIINNQTSAKSIDEIIDYNSVDKRLKPYLDYSREYLRKAVFSLPDIEHLEFPTGESHYFCNDERCTGCMACAEVCPVNAIKVKRDEEGFLVPTRDTDQCIDCLKCHIACQIVKPIIKRDIPQRYYAAKNTDEVRLNSSSGGVFTALSDEILNQGGVICAASMNGDFTVKHVLAATKAERDQMRKTLYVQSDISGVYKEIRKYLTEKTPVLFVGTPCQVAGLYHGLEDLDISLLYTCDIVCHGAPSPGVFESFIAYLRKWKGSLEEFNFRDKKLGWRHGYTVSAVFNGKKLINKPEIQSFSKMFSRSIINRRSCANCLYTNYDRAGDVTIGDCWGIEKKLPAFADRLGISLLIVNTKKGQDLVEKCAEITKEEITKAQTAQNSLMKQPEPSANRMNAFKIYKESGYETLAEKYGEINAEGRVITLIRNIIGK